MPVNFLISEMLPVFAALGGILVPASIYLAFNFQGQKSGAGIPVATDIAIALGVLAMLGKRVPVSLKIVLTVLAVIDDLAAIVIIAIFYTSTFDFQAFGIAMAIFAGLLMLNRLKVHNLLPYHAAAGGLVKLLSIMRAEPYCRFRLAQIRKGLFRLHHTHRNFMEMHKLLEGQ